MHRNDELTARICLALVVLGAGSAAFAQQIVHPRPSRTTAAVERLVPGRPCKSGFVWREAGRGDFVCVEPWARDRVRQENRDDALHGVRVRPGQPPQCRAGYVLRAAFAHDFVCVTPAAHAQAQDENALGPSRQA